MDINEAVKEFVQAHKPSRIDVDHITTEFGSIEGYLDAEGESTGDCGGRYVEVDSFDAKSGNPVEINWYEESWQIGYYEKCLLDRTSVNDHEPILVFERDFNTAIEFALEKLAEHDVYDLSIFRFADGAPMEQINMDDYSTLNPEEDTL